MEMTNSFHVCLFGQDMVSAFFTIRESNFDENFVSCSITITEMESYPKVFLFFFFFLDLACCGCEKKSKKNLRQET